MRHYFFQPARTERRLRRGQRRQELRRYVSTAVGRLRGHGGRREGGERELLRRRGRAEER